MVGYAASFVLLAQALKRGMPVGVAYSVWAACGWALVASIGVLLRESLSWVQVGSLGLVIAGVVAHPVRQWRVLDGLP